MKSEQQSMPEIGFIGLGTMGAPMARHLLQAGHHLTFYARRPEVIAEFSQLGATSVGSPAEVTHRASTVFTIVSADPQVREITLGPEGILAAAAPGKLLIDMSTIAPTTIRDVAGQLAARGMQTLDAPVSGGPWGAKSATLSIMVGGDQNTFESALPLLQLMGKHVTHFGPVGAGQTVKLINQLMAGGIMTLIAEGLMLGRTAGINLPLLVDCLLQSSGNSALLAARGHKFLLAGNYQPGFTTELMHKDMRLATELAQQFGVPADVAHAALKRYQQALENGDGQLDFAAVARTYERQTGVQLVPTTNT
jgi:3-hydroxyisobutyrate dehydrogenase-like beta-hydroxyacid dehydrogenase